MTKFRKIANACAGKWRTIGGISRETKIKENDVALIILKNPMEFQLNYNTPTGAATLVKRSW